MKRELKNQWISIEDRLPDDGDIVLFFTKNSKMIVGELHILEFHKTNEETGIEQIDTYYTVKGKFGLFNDVTHYMPLPEPPEVTK